MKCFLREFHLLNCLTLTHECFLTFAIVTLSPVPLREWVNSRMGESPASQGHPLPPLKGLQPAEKQGGAQAKQEATLLTDPVLGWKLTREGQGLLGFLFKVRGLSDNPSCLVVFAQGRIFALGFSVVF